MLRAIHRKVFLKRTNHKTGQKIGREKKRGERGKEKMRGIEEKSKKTVICGLILVKCLNFC